MERCRLSLWHFGDLAKHLGTAGLIKLGLDACLANCLKDANRAQPRHVAGVFGYIETDSHMTLCREVVNLIGLNSIEQFDEICGIGNIAVMQKKPHAVDVWIFVQMINAAGIER